MKTILILHGWQSSKEKWQKVKENLDDFNVVIPDIPGFKKETELGRPWDLDDYVDWVEEYVEAQHIKEFILLGHSFGGRVSIKFAQKHSLKGLILVSSAGIKRNSFKKRIFKVVASFIRVKEMSPLRKILYVYILRRQDYFKTSGNLKETMKKVIDEDLTSLLENIKVKTLLIWGDKDTLTPLGDGKLMNEKIKDSSLEVMKGIKHTPYIESPKELANIIRKYVTSI